MLNLRMYDSFIFHLSFLQDVKIPFHISGWISIPTSLFVSAAFSTVFPSCPVLILNECHLSLPFWLILFSLAYNLAPYAWKPLPFPPNINLKKWNMLEPKGNHFHFYWWTKSRRNKSWSWIFSSFHFICLQVNLIMVMSKKFLQFPSILKF